MPTLLPAAVTSTRDGGAGRPGRRRPPVAPTDAACRCLVCRAEWPGGVAARAPTAVPVWGRPGWRVDSAPSATCLCPQALRLLPSPLPLSTPAYAPSQREWRGRPPPLLVLDALTRCHPPKPTWWHIREQGRSEGAPPSQNCMYVCTYILYMHSTVGTYHTVSTQTSAPTCAWSRCRLQWAPPPSTYAARGRRRGTRPPSVGHWHTASIQDVQRCVGENSMYSTVRYRGPPELNPRPPARHEPTGTGPTTGPAWSSRARRLVVEGRCLPPPPPHRLRLPPHGLTLYSPVGESGPGDCFSFFFFFSSSSPHAIPDVTLQARDRRRRVRARLARCVVSTLAPRLPHRVPLSRSRVPRGLSAPTTPPPTRVSHGP